MRLLVVGAGSTGGYFGGRLAQAGRDVTFLVRPARAARLRADGLRIVSPHGDATLTPSLVSADEIPGPFDAVLLAVKAFALEAALDDMAAAVGPATMILPVLNGMKHIDALVARFGAGVVGCVCKVMTVLDDAGRIVQLNPMQELAYGELGGGASARTAALDAFMRNAGFDAKLSSDIERELWEKWMLLATLGAATCLMRGNVGEIEAAPGGREFTLALLDEVVAAVSAAGRRPRDELVAWAKTLLTAKGSPAASSMYRDMQSGARIEADQILGDLLLRAGRAGVRTPLLAAAYANLAIYQAAAGQKTAHD